MTWLELFLELFTRYQLNPIVTLTNAELKMMVLPATIRWYMMKIWVLILITRYEFASRRDLLSSRSQCKYIKPPGIRETGLMRPRLDHLWSCIRFSIQQQPRQKMMNMKEWEWQLINDQIENFNRHRLERLSISERLCVDERFISLYSSGGGCINLVLPHYMQMDCKPDAG